MNETLKHLDFLKHICGETILYLTEKEMNVIQLFCVGLLRRVHDTAVANSVLCAQFEENLILDYTIGISFRAIILDSLISTSVFNKINELELQQISEEEKSQQLGEFCKIFLSDGLRQTLSYIEDAHVFGFTSQKQKQESFKNIGQTYKPFLEKYADDGSKPSVKYEKAKTAKQLFEILAKTEDLKAIATIYDTYAYLSKYDHFGIIYYNAINETLETKIKIYSKVAEDMVAHATLLHVILARHSQNDRAIISQKDKANQYLLREVIEKRKK